MFGIETMTGTAHAATIGVLSGSLGVGGEFPLMPAMMYGLGVPRPSPSGRAFYRSPSRGLTERSSTRRPTR